MKKANRNLDSAMLSNRGLAFVAVELCTKLYYTTLIKINKLNYVTLCYKKTGVISTPDSTAHAPIQVIL